MKKIVFTVIGLLSMSLLAYSQIIIVPTDQPTIQDGINAANNGDTVLVIEGTYFENINMMGKEITLASEFIIDEEDSHITNTVIDGSQSSNPDQSSVITLISGESINTTICGFTIKNGGGNFPDPFGQSSGGGIYCVESGVTLSDNNIVDNQLDTENSSYGGGVFCYHSDIVIRNCMLFNNIATRGGGIYSQNSNIGSYNNDFMTNSAIENGGGFYFANNNNSPMDIELIVANNFFVGNDCEETTGGLTIRNDADNGTNVEVAIYGSEIAESNAAQRSGLNLRGNNLFFIVYNSSFSYNLADNYAAGVSLADQCAGEFYNCIFHSNQADLLGSGYNSGGVSLWNGAEAEFQNCVFADNTASFGSGLTVGGGGVGMAVNSIFWNNSTDQIALTSWDTQGGTLDILYCDIEGGTEGINLSPESVLNTGAGNINSDPIFAGFGEDPYSILDGSPCIDVGTTDTNGLELPSFDIIFNVRIWDGNGDGTAVIDMGAYEYNSEPVGYFNKITDRNLLVSAYPNPASLEITFSVHNSNDLIIKLEILDINGRVIKSEKNSLQKSKITTNVSGMKSGVYFGRLITGTSTYITKFVVE